MKKAILFNVIASDSVVKTMERPSFHHSECLKKYNTSDKSDEYTAKIGKLATEHPVSP